jgi:hypothetical protein
VENKLDHLQLDVAKIVRIDFFDGGRISGMACVPQLPDGSPGKKGCPTSRRRKDFGKHVFKVSCF